MQEVYGVDLGTYNPSKENEALYIHAFHTNNGSESGQYGERFIVIPERIGRGWMITQFSIDRFTGYTFQYQVKISSEHLDDGFIVAADDAEQVDMQEVFEPSDIAFIRQVVHEVIVPEMLHVRDTMFLQKMLDTKTQAGQ